MRSTTDKVLSHLREYICYHKQKAGKKQTLKVLLVRAQEEMRNIIKNRERENNPFLDSGKKKKNLCEFCSGVAWKKLDIYQG